MWRRPNSITDMFQVCHAIGMVLGSPLILAPYIFVPVFDQFLYFFQSFPKLLKGLG